MDEDAALWNTHRTIYGVLDVDFLCQLGFRLIASSFGACFQAFGSEYCDWDPD